VQDWKEWDSFEFNMFKFYNLFHKHILQEIISIPMLHSYYEQKLQFYNF
jgi:hypothetical protein